MFEPCAIEVQLEHLLQEIPFLGGRSQFSIFAIILAAEVLPIPFGPEKRSAWGIFPDAAIFDKDSLTAWLSSSSRLLGLYLR
jgi:hypothetical protein